MLSTALNREQGRIEQRLSLRQQTALAKRHNLSLGSHSGRRRRRRPISQCKYNRRTNEPTTGGGSVFYASSFWPPLHTFFIARGGIGAEIMAPNDNAQHPFSFSDQSMSRRPFNLPFSHCHRRGRNRERTSKEEKSEDGGGGDRGIHSGTPLITEGRRRRKGLLAIIT